MKKIKLLDNQVNLSKSGFILSSKITRSYNFLIQNSDFCLANQLGFFYVFPAYA